MAVWPKLAEQLKGRTAWVILCDFDGTLAPIVLRPEKARMPARTRQLLRRLLAHRGVFLGVISGRSLRDVRGRVGIPGLIYAGNHGFELAGRGLRFTHPAAIQHRSYLRKICRKLEKVVAGTHGSQVEWKDLTASVHWRGVKASERGALKRRLATVLAPEEAAGRLRLTRGLCVLEIRPPVDWGKGAVIDWLLDRGIFPKGSFLIFIGDDRTDEEAYRAVAREGGLTARVGPCAWRSRAQYQLRDPEEVQAWLQAVMRMLARSARQHKKEESDELVSRGD